jgi:hypothetical protein
MMPYAHRSNSGAGSPIAGCPPHEPSYASRPVG